MAHERLTIRRTARVLRLERVERGSWSILPVSRSPIDPDRGEILQVQIFTGVRGAGDYTHVEAARAAKAHRLNNGVWQ